MGSDMDAGDWGSEPYNPSLSDLRAQLEYARAEGKAIEASSLEREIWAALEVQPGFNEGMARAQADFDAGRVERYEHMTQITGVSETTKPSRWDWLEYDSGGPDENGQYWLSAKPKRWFALYPSFWRMVIRKRRLP